MAFFDELGKTLSMAGQAAVQKTKDVTETTRLNMTISEEEKNIKSLYLQIGELYASIHGNDYESDFSALMETSLCLMLPFHEALCLSLQYNLLQPKNLTYTSLLTDPFYIMAPISVTHYPNITGNWNAEGIYPITIS